MRSIRLLLVALLALAIPTMVEAQAPPGEQTDSVYVCANFELPQDIDTANLNVDTDVAVVRCSVINAGLFEGLMDEEPSRLGAVLMTDFSATNDSVGLRSADNSNMVRNASIEDNERLTRIRVSPGGGDVTLAKPSPARDAPGLYD